MAMPAPDLDRNDVMQVPSSVRLPIELAPPPSFDPADPNTWPRVEGRLEWVRGRLLWMPPCGVRQSRRVWDILAAVDPWLQRHPEFVGGTNEAGLLLDDEVRAADLAVFRAGDLDESSTGYARVAPVLAVEVSGAREEESALREKAAWYLAKGSTVVWLVLAEAGEVIVVTGGGERRYGLRDALPEDTALPGLAPHVRDFFRRDDAGAGSGI
jgi:Uma2 family endonuclease